MTKEEDIALLKRLIYEEDAAFLRYDPILKALARLVLESVNQSSRSNA
jgi:hypothetical protein